MIKTIIFDIGNVLADFKWEDFFRSFQLDEKTFERLGKATVLSEDWCEFDRGMKTDQEMLELFVENDPELEETIYRVFENMGNIVVKNDYTIPWIRALKEKGYQILVLSNFSHKAHQECTEALGFLSEVDGGILSYQDQLIKPMPQIYQLLIDRYQLEPQECVFLDDLQENLDGAARFGIHTIRFVNKQQAEEELRLLGVE